MIVRYRMGRIIAVANQKGGVGKTTTTINLSAAIGEKKKHVLVVDIDPQGNTTNGFGIDKLNLENTVYEVLLDECTAKEAIIKDIVDGVDLMPANVNLAGAEIELVSSDKPSANILKSALIMLRMNMIIFSLIARHR